tara:strand:+ start:402 stop:1040 length:639 start_codon:yes stop_codon:yes gene_type:complete
MKKIYFDGCSWTFGGELKDPTAERFSRLICDELGAQEVNISRAGGSNDRIVRQLLVENNIEEYDLAIIQMTFPARTEWYSGVDGKDLWKKVNPKFNYETYIRNQGVHYPAIAKRKVEKTIREKFETHKDFWKYWYMNVANEVFFDVKENIHFQTIRDHCKARGVPLILSTINRWSKLDFDFVLNTKGLKVHQYGHPTKESHQKFAKMMLDKI